jgi:mono/diheme cytochrome c family protein
MASFFRTSLLVAALALPAGSAFAEPLTYTLPDETAAFKDAPGVDAAQLNCSACHSADYIATQPPKMGHAFWEAEVKKMKTVYGAPIQNEDVKAIADYLASTY